MTDLRKKIIKGCIYAIFPILFNVMFFLLGGAEHPASVWLSYAWIHVAYAIMIAVPLFVRKTQSVHIFRFTSSQIASLYFGVELIVGVLFIFIGAEGVKAAIILQLIPFCLFLLIFLWDMLYNERTATSEQKRALEISFIKTAASKAKLLMEFTKDTDIKARMEKVYDLIHTSPTKSYGSVKELENSVMMLLNELGFLLEENNEAEIYKSIRKIEYTMEERNRIVTLSN